MPHWSAVLLLLVRHAHALSRSTWERDDDVERPLSDKGRRQAELLAPALAGYGPTRIVSSPAVRCLDTVAPLSASVGVPVEVDDRLAEAGSAKKAVDLVRSFAGGEVVVLCSHGDLIPDILGSIVAEDGVDLGENPKVEKSSAWAMEACSGRFHSAKYLGPPKV